MNYNIKKKDHHFNLFFLPILRKHNIPSVTDPTQEGFFCSSRTVGKYCINFVRFDCFFFFNKISTTLMLRECPYYPKSHLFKNIDELNNGDKLDKNKYYFVKPKHGGRSTNISYFKGKEALIMRGGQLKFPLIFQEEILDMKKEEGRRYDLRVHVIYIKTLNGLKGYYYNDVIKRLTFKGDNNLNSDNIFTNVDDSKKETEKILRDYNNENLLNTLKSASSLMKDRLSKQKRYRELEILIVGYDIMIDKNDKHWILEINCNPCMYYPGWKQKVINQMMEEIYEMILSYHQTKQFVTNKFIKIL